MGRGQQKLIAGGGFYIFTGVLYVFSVSLLLGPPLLGNVWSTILGIWEYQSDSTACWSPWVLKMNLVTFWCILCAGLPRVLKSPDIRVFINQTWKVLKLNIGAEQLVKKSRIWLVFPW